MKSSHTNLRKTACAVAAFAGATSLFAAGPAAAQGLPSYASVDETITGTILSVDGDTHLSVRDDRGFVDNVSLRNGTVINPTGLRLAPGQSVTIHGRTEGKSFAASEIDTPYHTGSAAFVYPAPAYVAYPYPYPAYAYVPGPSYRVGLFFGRGFGFGFRGW